MSALANPLHEQFAQLWADATVGKTKATIEGIYTSLFPESHPDDSIKRGKAANQFAARQQIIGRRNELLKACENRKTLSRERVRMIRAEIAESDTVEPRDRLTALRDESKMMGWDEPEKVEASISVFIRTDFEEEDE